MVIATAENYIIKNGKNKDTYCNIPFAFDIETTSTVNCYGEEVAFPYILQFTFEMKTYYATTGDEIRGIFDHICDKLDTKKVICLVHNLSYEFCFMSNYLNFTNIFALDKNKVAKCDYRNIEFRCTYILTNTSLENLAKNHCKTKKLVGDLDYKKVRTPQDVSNMKPQELAYCENDVVILSEYWTYCIVPTYINNCKNGMVWLPLTQTSKVRKLVKDNISNKKELKNIISKTKPSVEVQNKLELAFMGGYTHANIMYTNTIVNNVKSYDLTSSYPAVMLYKKYPMGRFLQTKRVRKKSDMKSDHAYLFTIELVDLKPKSTTHTISISKCQKTKNVVIDNGRVIKADYISTTITDIDLETIDMFYTYSKYRISDVYTTIYGKLPKYLTSSIVSIYNDKLRLKPLSKKYPDNDDIQSQYMRCKESINSLYGMCVTNPTHDTITFDNNKWTVIPEDYNQTAQWSDFLLYQWGVWVTAHARHVLLVAVSQLGDDILYCDTDSCKYVGDHTDLFDTLNNNITKDIIDMIGHDTANKVKSIGLWDFEGTCKEFITLGAKKYAWDNEPTVSGVGKSAIKEETKRLGISMAEHFKNGFTMDEKHSCKNTVKYHWDTPTTYNYSNNGKEYTINIVNFIHMSETTFKMDMTPQYLSLCNKYQK